MTYFSDANNPEDFEDGFAENEGTSRSSRIRVNVAIFLIICGALGMTFAANISLGGNGRREFGQGIFQIKACDSWIGVGLTSGQGVNADKVYNIDFYGLDPRACSGTLLRLKLYDAQKNTMNMYYGAGATQALSDSVTANTLTIFDTTTAYSGNTLTAYHLWAYNAITLIDPQGRNAKYGDSYLRINYIKDPAKANGIYTVALLYPIAISADVSGITLETAKPQ